MNQKLIDRFLGGEVEAFKKVVSDNYNALLKEVTDQVGSDELAKGIVKEVFVRTWQNRRSVTAESFEKFLIQTTAELIRDLFRKAVDNTRLEKEICRYIEKGKHAAEKEQVPDESVILNIKNQFLQHQLIPQQKIP